MANPNPLSDEMPSGQRRVFVAVITIGLLCFFLYLLDLKVTELTNDEKIPQYLRQHTGIIKSILENLIAGAIAAILLALTFKWIVALVDPRDRVIEITPSNITSRLLKNAAKTRNYLFIGNTATFVSAAVLPVLSDVNRSTGIPRSIKLILIDPTDEETLKRYSEFKLRAAHTASKVGDQYLAQWVSPSVELRGESSDEIAAKVLTAIYLGAFTSLQAGMDVSIYLRKSFTPFRADMTNSEVVLTQESANESAVAFAAQGHFYGWYNKEAEAQCMQATQIDIIGERENLRQLGLVHPRCSKGDIRKALVALGTHFSYLNGLVSRKEILDLASTRIAHPNHAYQI